MSDSVHCIRNTDYVIELIAFVEGSIGNDDPLNIATERIGTS